MRSKLGAKFALVEFGFEAGEKCSVEEKAEVVQRLQEVVNAIQVRELTKVIKMLGDSVFQDPQPRFYVVIDKLDENWVDDHFRYRLIKALVETVTEINHHMPGVKIVVALRRDLLDRVIQETRDAGFQEEKHEPLYLKLKWSKSQLFEMLNARVHKLVRRRYTGKPVGWADLLPKEVNKEPIQDFLIDRTMYRPRDVIVFFNICIEQAEDRPEITRQMIMHAEEVYSHRRLRSLYDEWHAEYPELPRCVTLLKSRPARFKIGDAWNDETISEVCLAIAAEAGHPHEVSGPITRWAILVFESKVPPREFRVRIAEAFYRVGLIGLRVETSTATSWSYIHAPAIPAAAIKDDAAADICPVFFRTLGVNAATRGR